MKHSSVTSEAGLVDTTRNLREKLQDVITVLDSIPSAPPVPVRERSVTVKESDVRAILRARRSRAHFFPEGLFAEPAWDMLLELYAAELAQRRVAISSLCIAAAVPATTALRWISSLDKKGLITRQNDPFDGRRYFVSLSQKGSDALEAYFGGLQPQVPGVI